MASLQPYRHKNKPWRAKRKRDGNEYFLGYYATKDEAEQREREFDNEWPRHSWKGCRRERTSSGRLIWT